MKRDEIAGFITANTRLLHPPLVPEIALHLAEESMPIWRSTEEQLGEMNVPPPYWAFAWAGGQALARYILDVPESVAGKAVLDIGSGSGLVALAAKLAGAKSALANDIDAFAVTACIINATANGISIETSGADLISDHFDFDDEDIDADFFQDDMPDLSVGTSDAHKADAHALNAANSNEHDPDSFDIAGFDIVCLGDTFYEEALAIDAMLFAERARMAGARILIGDPSRSYFPHERFNKIIDYAVPVTRELEDNEIKNSAVWEYRG